MYQANLKTWRYSMTLETRWREQNESLIQKTAQKTSEN
jgi:hypothetical protein